MIESEVEYEMGKFSYLFSCLFGIWCGPLGVLPCICKRFKDTVHYCPDCG